MRHLQQLKKPMAVLLLLVLVLQTAIPSYANVSTSDSLEQTGRFTRAVDSSSEVLANTDEPLDRLRAAESPNIKDSAVLINGEQTNLPANSVQVQGDRVLVPGLIFPWEALGLTATWNNDKTSVNLTDGTILVSMKLEGDTNGRFVREAVEPLQKIGDIVYVPIKGVIDQLPAWSYIWSEGVLNIITPTSLVINHKNISYRGTGTTGGYVRDIPAPYVPQYDSVVPSTIVPADLVAEDAFNLVVEWLDTGTMSKDMPTNNKELASLIGVDIKVLENLEVERKKVTHVTTPPTKFDDYLLGKNKENLSATDLFELYGVPNQSVYEPYFTKKVDERMLDLITFKIPQYGWTRAVFPETHESLQNFFDWTDKDGNILGYIPPVREIYRHNITVEDSRRPLTIIEAINEQGQPRLYVQANRIHTQAGYMFTEYQSGDRDNRAIAQLAGLMYLADSIDYPRYYAYTAAGLNWFYDITDFDAIRDFFIEELTSDMKYRN